MNCKLMIPLIVILAGCDSTEPIPEPAPSNDVPPEATDFVIGYPATSSSGGTGSGPPIPYTMCDLVGAHEALIIVDVEEATLFTQSRDCDEEPEFRTGYWALTANVSTSLSAEVEAGSRVVLHMGGEWTYPPPREGRLLVGVRKSKGNLWMTEAVEVATAPTSNQLTPVDDDRPYEYRLPKTYFELIDEFERIKADPKSACADNEELGPWAKTKTMSQQAYDDYVNTPNEAERPWCAPDYVPFVPDMGDSPDAG